MKKRPMFPCSSCGQLLRIRKDRKTTTCKECLLSKMRCIKCGQIMKDKHVCASVDEKPQRNCEKCQKILKNIGWERYHKICGKCSALIWTGREKNFREELRMQFGGKCQICGFSECINCLHFHHIDSTEKHKWKNVLFEVQKHPERFRLLCPNCHCRIHHDKGFIVPDYSTF